MKFCVRGVKSFQKLVCLFCDSSISSSFFAMWRGKEISDSARLQILMRASNFHNSRIPNQNYDITNNLETRWARPPSPLSKQASLPQ